MEKMEEIIFLTGLYDNFLKVEWTLPDGTVMQANVHRDTDYPCIGISMLSQNGEKTALCFAEYNPEKEPGHRLCIGVYCADEDDTVYYDSYNRFKSQ